MESLLLLKYAENAIADDLERMAKNAPPKDAQVREHLMAFFKRAAFNYRALTLLFERKQFPAIAAVYRARAELYDDFLQGKVKSPQLEKREAENESAKMRALTQELAALQKSEPAFAESRRKSLEELGGTIGRGIAVAAMMNATPASSAEKAEPAKPTPSPQSAPSLSAPLVGYGHVSRSDGLKTFFVNGTFPTVSECERITKIFVDNTVASAKVAGHTAKLESSACETGVPRGTEYESLRHGTPTKHYVFFTESMRLMFVHERGTADYERAMCERMRDAMNKALSADARCDPPKTIR